MNQTQQKLAELQQNGWTLAAIAEEIGVTVNAVEKWKAGARTPTNIKGIWVLLDQLAQRKRVPKQRRYASGSRQGQAETP